MADGSIIAIQNEVLLADIGCVIAVSVLCQKMVEGLVLVRAQLGRYRLVPLFGIVEFGININDHTPKWIKPMTYNRTNTEFRLRVVHQDPTGPQAARPHGCRLQRSRNVL